METQKYIIIILRVPQFLGRWQIHFFEIESEQFLTDITYNDIIFANI